MSRFRTAAAVLPAIFALGLASPANANLILGEFLGFGDGTNDSVEAILEAFSLQVTMLARIEPDDGSDPVSGTVVDGLSYFNFVLNIENEPAGGEWLYDGSLGVADLIAVKAGPNWGVWRFTDAATGGMPNMGLFNTLQLQPGNDPGDQRGFGDVTAYQIDGVVPEPSVLALVGLGLAGLAGLGRRR